MIDTLQSIGMGLSAGLYAFVGHGGGSAYLALGASRSQALLMNLLVAGIAGVAFSLGGRLRWRLLLPLLAGSIPAVLVGGRMDIGYGRYLVAFALLCEGLRLLFDRYFQSIDAKALPSPLILLALGAGLGLLSGVTGIGGGVYLSPIILLMGWAGARETSAVAALFIWANSLAGLSALSVIQAPPDAWILMAFLGGSLGVLFGARLAPLSSLKPALGLVLIVASLKPFGLL